MDRAVSLPDGRTLLTQSGGADEGPTILSFHGSTMGRTLYSRQLDDCRTRGVRALSFDRPGLGGSTPNPGYRLSDVVADVRALAAAYGIERLPVWGVSGGTLFALACGALAPDLVTAVAILSPSLERPQPWDDPEAKRVAADAFAANDRQVDTVEKVVAAYGDGVPPVDLEAMKGDVGVWLATDAPDANSSGGAGAFGEGWALRQDWGFEPEDIKVPVLLVHGTEDPWHKPSDSEAFVRRLPRGELRLKAGEGHFSLMHFVPEVNEWLLQQR